MVDKNHNSIEYEKTEQMWWKKLEIHYSIYKDSLHAFNAELATAGQTFSNRINSNLNNTHTFFATVERLANNLGPLEINVLNMIVL